jgi:hypothetical protein
MPSGVYPRPSIFVRFEKHYIPEPNSGCWLWTAADTEGEPKFSVEGQTDDAARASWRLYKGAIPTGLQVLHRCDMPLCVNPDHLFLGTQSDNMADMKAKGRGRAPKGEANGKTKLTDREVWELRQLRWYVSQRTLARAYGVSNSTVDHIQARRHRKDGT